MSLLSNANMTRYGIISSWSSNWVESNILYSSLVYTDIYINELINGIYYKLKMPNSLPIIKNIGYQKTLIFVNSFIFHKETRLHKWRNYYRGLFYMKYIRRRFLFNINKICKSILYYNNIKTYDIKSFICLSGYNIYKQVYFINNNKLNMFRHNTNIKTKYYKKLNINIFKRIKYNENRNKKIIFTKKNNKKNTTLYNYINKKLYILKKYSNINSINTKNIFINKINNAKYQFYKMNNKSYVINKKKMCSIIRYKKKINNILNNKFNMKNTINHIKMKLKKLSISKKNVIKKLINNINFSIYFLLIYKLSNIYIYIYIYILLNTIINNSMINYIFNIYLLINNIINNIKKINIINNINVNILYIFNNKFKLSINKINIIKSNRKYNRIRSQYRLKKKIDKLNKEKKYNMYRRIILYQHYLDFVCDTPKYITKVNKELIYKQLCFKINDTINYYLNSTIYYMHNHNEYYYNRIDNPKLLSDFIKILMKYEEKNPSILKKIVKIHSSQNKKSKVFNRKYIKKSLVFIKKIHNKLKIKNYYFNIYNKTIKKNKLIKKQITLKNNKYIKNDIKFDIRSIYKKNNSIYNNNIKDIKTLSINRIKNIKKIKLNTINNNNVILLPNKYNYCKYLYKWLLNIKLLRYKKYPLIGMRIELSGPTKKGRRTQTHLYNEWVDFYTLPGKMQLVKIINDIKYWQSYGLTQRASIGIKVWMHFHTIRHSELRKNIIE